MNISILSVFPDFYDRFIETSLVRRARESKAVTFDIQSYASFVRPGSRIDAPTFGHGDGMLIKPEVVQKAVEEQEKKYGSSFKVFFSPHGKKMDQSVLKSISKKVLEKKHLILLPARYEGMDARVEKEYADEILSVGDFVLMGGDVPTMMFLEGFLRLIPGVVGKPGSVEHDSFSGALVDYPEFTEPVVWKEREVPAIIRSGNHAEIKKWRMKQAAQRTVEDHFGWLRQTEMTKEEKNYARGEIPPHYVVLMHDQVLVGPEAQPGKTSVTSIDIHDIARSAKTFGVKQFFIVTPLKDQQKIVKKLLHFWQEGVGIEYNPERHEALKSVTVVESIDEVVKAIEEKEKSSPLLVTTSAKQWSGKSITYHDQSKVWKQKQPVLFLFGTGRGLDDELMDRSDFVLVPVVGFFDFNHLSVRSAVAIILDRWIGINIKRRG